MTAQPDKIYHIGNCIADTYHSINRYKEGIKILIGPNKMAGILGVQPVTVRKYSDILEKAGYVISRSENGRREYSEKDAMIFREVIELCERSGMKLEAAANLVVSREMRDAGVIAHTEIVPVNDQNEQLIQYEERYNELKQIMLSMEEQQRIIEEQNRVQAEELARLHKKMDDQNNNLSVILRETLETRRMIAAANEQKRKPFWKFWSKENSDDRDPEVVWNRKMNATESLYEAPGREKK